MYVLHKVRGVFRPPRFSERAVYICTLDCCISCFIEESQGEKVCCVTPAVGPRFTLSKLLAYVSQRIKYNQHHLPLSVFLLVSTGVRRTYKPPYYQSNHHPGGTAHRLVATGASAKD